MEEVSPVVETEQPRNVGSFVSEGRASILGIDQAEVYGNYREAQASGLSFTLGCYVDSGFYSGRQPQNVFIGIDYCGKNEYLFSINGEFINENGIYDTEQFVFLESELRNILPIREMVDQMRDVFVEYYREVLEMQEGEVDSESLIRLLQERSELFPKLFFERGWMWLGDFVMGMAWKAARDSMNDEISSMEESKFWDMHEKFMHILQLECGFVAENCSDAIGKDLASRANTGSTSLFGTWTWSWVFYDASFSDGYVYTKSKEVDESRTEARRRIRDVNDQVFARLRWRSRFVLADTLGGMSGVGKSTLGRALTKGTEEKGLRVEVLANTEKRKIVGHTLAKERLAEAIQDFGEIRFLPSPVRAILRDGEIILTMYHDDINEDEFRKRYRPFKERWELYMMYTLSAARWARVDVVDFCENYPLEEIPERTHIYFETMAEAPLVFSFILNWGSEIDEYIQRNHPSLLEELENDVTINIPADVRFLMEQLILEEDFLDAFVNNVIGKCWFVDMPTKIPEERIDAEIAQGVESRRGIYRDNLVLMRLTNLVLAKMFPNYFRVVQAATAGREEPRSMMPGQIAWTLYRQAYLCRLPLFLLSGFNEAGFPPATMQTFPQVRGNGKSDCNIRFQKGVKRVTDQARDVLQGAAADLVSMRRTLEGVSPADLLEERNHIEIADLHEINMQRRRNHSKKEN